MERWLRGRILTVGDGDFSFSSSLLRFDPPELCATCYDDEDTVCSKYASARSSIDTIRARYECHCGVDATSLPSKVTSRQFDRAIFQFPLVPPVTKDVWATGVDVSILNRELLLGFLRQVEPLLAKDGLVMITSKDVKPYLNWRIDWALCPHTRSLKYLGKLAFNPEAFSDYQFQNVERDQRVKCTEAYTYLFGWKAPADKHLVPPCIVPPNALYCTSCPAGPFSGPGDMENHNNTAKHKEKVVFEERWTQVATATNTFPSTESRADLQGIDARNVEHGDDRCSKRMMEEPDEYADEPTKKVYKEGTAVH